MSKSVLDSMPRLNMDTLIDGCDINDEGSIALQEDDEIDDDDDHIPALDLHKSQPLHEIDKLPSRLKQKPGSLRGARTRGRRHRINETHWGNASTPVISIKDIMGGERNATKVGLSRSNDFRPNRGRAEDHHDRQCGAETKKNRIIGRKMAKKNRQLDVKNSLAHFLQSNEDTESDSKGDEDESLISEEDEKGKTDNFHDSGHKDEKNDDDKSIKSTKSHSRMRRHHPRRTQSDKGPTGGGSSHSRKRPPRRRTKQAEADDDASVGSRKSRLNSRRTAIPDDGSVGSRRRRGHSRSADINHRRRDHGKVEDGDGKHGSHSRRRSPADDADDRSVGSRKSVGRRRRQGGHGRPPRHKSPAPASKEDGNRTALVSPEAKPVSPEAEPVEKDEVGEIKTRMASLANHLESNLEGQGRKDPEEESEESSRFSLGYQPTLLQFDPTNANHFTLVNQEEGNLTSENIRNADGTESELQIRELANLPTFEAPQPSFHDSTASNFSPVSPHDSQKSMQVSDGEGELQLSTEADAGKSQSDLGRGVAETRSFLQRFRRRKENDESDEEAPAQSTQSMFGRKKRAPIELTHQSLDDYGSD